ncbi:MAG: hypothetical protein KJ955_08920 [Nanoarchaeota archaeon]|nr:hypothetical protein [Nanoarchaeota archaeon]
MVIHVPLEIRVAGYNGEPFASNGGFSRITASAGIINGDGQMLVKLDSEEGYSVFTGFPNENTVTNYYLAKRKRPKQGRLYFATDYDEDDETFEKYLKSIENYVLFTNKDTYVFWKPIEFPSERTVFEIHHRHTWQFNNWNHFYEVKKRKGNGRPV